MVVGIDENNDHGELAAGLDQVGGFHAVAAEESGDGVNGGGGVDIFLAQVVENLQMKRAVAPLATTTVSKGRVAPPSNSTR